MGCQTASLLLQQARRQRARRLRWWQVPALVVWLAIPTGGGWASTHTGVMSTEGELGHSDPSVRRAQSLLQTTSFVPVEVVDIGKLPRRARRMAEQTCAYIRKGVHRIYVNSSCPVYQAARDSRFDAMKFAAILRHEMAHLDGADEATAYLFEARTFRDLLREAPAHLLSRGLAYAVELERRAAALTTDTDRQPRTLTQGRESPQHRRLRHCRAP
jgi:hypothetical protein